MGWKSLPVWYQLSYLLAGMLVCLLGVHLVIWRSMDRSIEMLQQEVAQLDVESRGLIQKIDSLKGIERDITTLRENLSSHVQQFPSHIESNSFRRDVVELAKRRNVTIRLWKPEGPLRDLQHSQTAIPIAVKVEGNFQGTLEFLDDLRQLAWVQGITSLVISREQGSEDSSFIITNITIKGLTLLGIEHVQKLLKA